MRRLVSLGCFVSMVLVSATAAQLATGSVTGTVRIADEGDALPAVVVTARSRALQGTRTTVSDHTGAYILALLPPGEYELTFTGPGLQAARAAVRVQVGQTVAVDAQMARILREEILVSDRRETISSGSTSATTHERRLIEALPTDRDLRAAALLTPGVAPTGLDGALVIAGASSAESLFLVNGVVVNDNVTGDPYELFIEDAIDEVTTMVSGISAEHGRFTGGVVSMLTRSGGNDVAGAIRVNLANDDWQARTPLTTAQEDEVNPVYEGTLGGYLLRDRLWFFAAARDRELTRSRQLLDPAGTPFTHGDQESRFELKLTASPHVRHRFVGSYLEIDRIERNWSYYPALEPTALDPSRELPQEMFSVSYSGVLTENLFVEAQHSERDMTLVDAGGSAPRGDRIRGTPIIESPSFTLAGSAMFCGHCDDEQRDNESTYFKGSYFLTTEKLGSHELVAGYDAFVDVRTFDFHQSPSDFVIFSYSEAFVPADGQFGTDGAFYPVFLGASGAELAESIVYWPVLVGSRGTDLVTRSAFVNDSWRVTDRLTVNLGVRWDDNEGRDAAGTPVADDSRISPRLGVSWDPLGNGRWDLHGGYGRYVAAIGNPPADRGGAGVPAGFFYSYLGPPVNLQCAVPGELSTCIPVHEHSTREALAIVFDWFESVGGLARTDLWSLGPAIPGVNMVVDDLRSPFVDELTLGLSRRIGRTGLVRVDYVHRDYGDFYAFRLDRQTGTVNPAVELAPGVIVRTELEVMRMVNEDDLLEQRYDGLHVQGSYRLGERVGIGATWSWSHARGNHYRDSSPTGYAGSPVRIHPEYRNPIFDRLHPYGDLEVDQRHRVRAWSVVDLLESRRHHLSVGVLQSFATGTPYSAVTDVVLGSLAEHYGDPGYLRPPLLPLPYYLSGLGAYRWDDVSSTDLSLNYALALTVGGQDLELYFQPEVLNLFNERAVIGGDTVVECGDFDPYAQEPVFLPREEFLARQEAGDSVAGYWTFGASFGRPRGPGDYQRARTFRVSLGVRF